MRGRKHPIGLFSVSPSMGTHKRKLDKQITLRFQMREKSFLLKKICKSFVKG